MPLSNWRAPIFRLLIPFAIGILLYDRLGKTYVVASYSVLVCLLMSTIASWTPIKWRWKIHIPIGSMIWIGIIAFGMLYACLRDIRNDPSWIGHQKNQKQWLVEFRGEADRTQTGWCMKADVIAAADSKDSRRVRGGILIYTKDSAIASTAWPGKNAWIQTTLCPILNQPGSEFDFARYNRQKKITHQTFIRSQEQIQYVPTQSIQIRSYLNHIRVAIRKNLYNHLRDSARAGLATALFIGWKEGLDPDLKQHYTRTGTVHIIAISGMHISLVFEALWMLLYPLLFLRGGSFVRTALALIGIWLFCFLAGGEASVMRAGIMFTAIHVGRWLQRPMTGEQALGLSMLFLLMADPDWLFDVGFQLSHGAVLGILALQSRFTNSISLQNPLLKHTWNAASMTIAATIGTLPFTSLYFHQFPLLFLPANLIAVPLSSLTLIGLFILLPLSIWPEAGDALGWCLGILLDGMNGWVERLDRIPGMVWQW